MRAPTGNAISQGLHGNNAVDYHSSPDPYIYAPEDGMVVACLLDAGDSGNELMVQGPAGRHGFCHCEVFYVKVGDRVTKGQRIAKMGYTGKTDPVGPAGTHLHWVIYRYDRTYVYPPSLVNEPFGSQGVTTMAIEKTYDNGDKVNVAALFGIAKEEAASKKDWNDVFYAIVKPSVIAMQKRIGELEKELAVTQAASSIINVEALKEALK
jgi:murein DD-endopeptidase MepM/ murein hydrolase activator NlpD